MATEGRREKNERQQPVQFRGLSTHYVAGEDIRASFRYPASSFQPRSEDKVKLYAAGSRERSVASASVGDTSEHRLCDGGLYKTGSVGLVTTQLSGGPLRSFVLVYASSRLRRVVGRSEPFIVCPQEEFPSIQIRTAEDNAFIEKLRSHSPVGSAARAESGEPSFTALSGGLSGEWEVLEEEESSGSESWSDVGEDPATLSKSGHCAGPGKEVDTGGPNPRKCTPPAEHQPGSSEPTALQQERGQGEGVVMLKNANKELRTKVRVLHDKLHSVSRERDHLQVSMDDVAARLSLLQHDKTGLKHKNKKLTEEALAFRVKNKQLLRENAVLTQHCQKQVAQMSQYETQLKTISSESLQLAHHHTRRKSKPTANSSDSRKQVTFDPSPSGRRQKPVKHKVKPVVDVYVRDTEKAEEEKTPLRTNGPGKLSSQLGSQPYHDYHI